jgi:hypothetical protein
MTAFEKIRYELRTSGRSSGNGIPRRRRRRESADGPATLCWHTCTHKHTYKPQGNTRKHAEKAVCLFPAEIAIRANDC